MVDIANSLKGDSLLFYKGLFCSSYNRKGLYISCLAAGAYSASLPCTCPEPRPCFNFGLRSPQVFACKLETFSGPRAPPSNLSSILRPTLFSYEKFLPNPKQPIRLLRLHPRKQPDKVKFSLQTHSLLSFPAYEALSYTWASSGEPILIYSDTDIPFLSARNLVTALIALRYPDKPRMLWADAICINQEDTEERNKQVENMASVYRRAAQVLVWLGEAAHESDDVFRWIARERKRQIAISQKIAKATQGRPEMLERLRKYADVDPKVNASFSALIKETVHVLPSEMTKFFDKAYFTRVWVVQETYYASSIQDTFVSAYTTYIQSRGLESQFPRASGTIPGPFALAAFRNQKSLYGPATRGEMLGGTGFKVNLILRAAEAAYIVSTGQAASKILSFAKSKSYKASNPLDKVYALLNLVQDCTVTINYSRGVPDVFKDVAFAIIQQSRSLELLTMANCARETAYRLRSWVPDWSEFDGNSMPLQLSQVYRRNVFESAHMRPYAASGKLAKANPTHNGDILTVSGYLIDILVAAGPKLPNFTLFWNSMGQGSQDGIIQCLFEWDKIAMNPALSPNGQPKLILEHAEEAFCLTLSQGTYWVGTSNRNLTLSEFHKWRTDLHSTAFHTPEEPS